MYVAYTDLFKLDSEVGRVYVRHPSLLEVLDWAKFHNLIYDPSALIAAAGLPYFAVERVDGTPLTKAEEDYLRSGVNLGSYQRVLRSPRDNNPRPEMGLRHSATANLIRIIGDIQGRQGNRRE